MTRVDEFNSFYAATSAQTLRVMYAATGDRQVAREATVDAYRRAWRGWSKVRAADPLSYVRSEAWKAVPLSRGTHPLRRRHEDDSDTALLDALDALPSDDRRMIVLLTLGDVDLEDASREVGVTAEEGIEGITNGLSTLERTLGQGIDQIERRLHALSEVTSTLVLPSDRDIRVSARRGERRNTVLLVAVALVAIVLGGYAVTDGSALATDSAMPDREKLGAETTVETFDARTVDADDLLTPQQVRRLSPASPWRVTSTDTNAKNTEPYATCPIKRFGNPDPERVFVRTYAASGDREERVAQAIEVAKDRDAAAEAYRTLVTWYADCTHPRVQLLASYSVERPFGDFQILRLRSYRNPERTFTVGFSHSGTVTSTVVHETRGRTAPSIESFAQTLNDAVLRVCLDSGGTCSNDVKVVASNPPPTSRDPAFLGIVDLPPVADIDNVWAGTPATVTKQNPATTPCRAADFAAAKARTAGSRVFLIPEAKDRLPAQFAVAQTVARFPSAKAARSFLDDSAKAMADCPDDNLAATLSQSGESSDGPQRSRTWRLTFEVGKKEKVYYRMGLVQRGNLVSQVTLSTTKAYDIPRSTFESLTARAGQRLVYAK